MKRHNCPCCGYPTLEERRNWEICSLCNWEDDGQDDPHADQVWGGPNQDYSLTEARETSKDITSCIEIAEQS
ncbi:CPCC family cysteine-rich protein [Paenibacillus yanchengensis]|uniref:CPCC family cysteine-rich protein n=1 Tax=Paenibacillus yanchengensis TaxID=2035833 RepID=A0ABW4YJ09_9BACL